MSTDLADAVEHVATQKLQGTGEPRTASDSDEEVFDPSRPLLPDNVPDDTNDPHHPDYFDPSHPNLAIYAEEHPNTPQWINGVAVADTRAHAAFDEIPEHAMTRM